MDRCQPGVGSNDKRRRVIADGAFRHSANETSSAGNCTCGRFHDRLTVSLNRSYVGLNSRHVLGEKTGPGGRGASRCFLHDLETLGLQFHDDGYG